MTPWTLIVALAVAGQGVAGDPAAELEAAASRGDGRASVRAAQAVLALRERELASDPAALAHVLDEIAARVAAAAGPDAEAFAEGLLLRSLSLQEENGRAEPASRIPTLVQLSDLYYGQGRWRDSARFDRRLLELRLTLLGSDHPDVAASRQNLGFSLFRQGRLQEALPMLEEAVRILEASSPPRPTDLAAALGALAEDLRAQNRYREAETLFLRALELHPPDAAGDTVRLDLLINLSGLYRDVNRYAESEWQQRQALALLEASPSASRPYLATVRNNLAELRRYQGDPKGAEALYLAAIEAASEAYRPDHPRLATYRNQLALLYAEQGRLADAETLFRSVLAVRIAGLGKDHPDTAYTYQDLGLVLQRSGRVAEAEASFQRALAIREERLGPRHPEVALSLLALARCLESAPKRGGEVRRLVDRAVSILESTPAEARAQAGALSFRATLQRQAGRQADALADLAKSLDLVARLRPEAGGGEQTRARFLSGYVADFHRMIAWQLERGDVAAAFSYAERARAQALQDQLAASHVDLKAGIEPAERERLDRREADVLGRLAEARAALEALYAGPEPPRAAEARAQQKAVQEAAAEFQRVFEETRNASRLWRGAARPDAGLSLAEVQQKLIPVNAVMLLYVVGRGGSWLFLVPAPGRRPQVFRLTVSPDEASILGAQAGPLTSELLRHVLAPDPDLDPGSDEGLLVRLASPPGGRRQPPAALLASLFRVLVPTEAWAVVSESEEAIVIPDDRLYQLPFEALAVKPGDRERAPRYWLDAGPLLRYGASATALFGLDPGPSAASLSVLSVSGVTYDASLEPLPGTARETDAIRAAFGDSAVRALQGVEAREPRVRSALPSARYLHLATHGLVDQAGGELLATLALAPPPAPSGPGDDGRLQLYELYETRLDSELAVLSACQSRVGEVVAGEGVFALSRGFLAAGARRVVASLWMADDDATAALVSGLFRAVAESEGAGRRPDFARALRDAKRAVRARPEWQHPFFWAPFVIEGAR